MTNILEAITTIINNPIPDLLAHYRSKSKNRINAVGDALEEFVKDAFADTIHENSESRKIERQSQVFSWTGNQNNPPDLIIRGGDAVEVKKIQSLKSQIALNSSYPKHKLFSDSPMIASDCRTCEAWTEKDIIYAIGFISQQKLMLLWLIYGDCYGASKEYYEIIRNKISSGIHEIPDVEFAETNELGRVNKVDPLGITYLRIRGMWGIDNPLKVYGYLNLDNSTDSQFRLIALMKQSKYLSFPEKSRNNLESISNPRLTINDQKIKSPDNPSQLISAKIIIYSK
jgi:hypothetical protein